MDHYQNIANSFQVTIETIASSVDALALPIEQSSLLMTEALLAGGKIVTVGLGADAALASLLADTLLCNTNYERPALPALALPAGGSLENTVRQLRALVQQSDVIVLFAISPCDLTDLNRLLDAAGEGNARSVLVSNLNVHLDEPKDGDSVVIELGDLQHIRAVELTTMISCCLGTLIENNLFGYFNETTE